MAFSGHQPHKQLLCDAVDERAHYLPSSQKPFCIHPISSELNDGWRDVSFRDLAAAVNYMAWWIEKKIGRTSGRSEPLAYVGINDIRYPIFVLACMKIGYAAFLPSPRNSEPAFLHLLKETGCYKFVYSPERYKVVHDLQRVRKNIQSWEVPPLWEMIGYTGNAYPCVREYNDAEDDTSIIIHSSGTTGFPKPVNITNGYWSAMCNLFSLPVPPGRQRGGMVKIDPNRIFFGLAPFFHQMGNYLVVMSICYNTPFVLSPPEKPLTLELITRILDEKKPTVGLLLPSVMEDLSSTEEGKKTLERFRTIFFGGAPLAQAVGDKLSNLEIALGSSEEAMLPTLVFDTGSGPDWQYFEWNPYYGIEMRPISDQGMHEMVLCRPKPGDPISTPRNRDYHCIFHTFPHLDEYHTKDVFLPHPTKPNLWRYHGRVDDVIVLSNGEKFNPIEMEKALDGHPLISRSLVVGQGQFHSAAIIEPNWKALPDPKIDRESFIDLIWSSVEKANQIAPAYGRLMKSKIRLGSREKPFKSTPKGSIQRNATIADYKQEIQDLYTDTSEESSYTIPHDPTLENVLEIVESMLATVLSVGRVPENADIFALGLDSLQTLQLSRNLVGAVRSVRPDLDVNAVLSTQKIYLYPSVTQLSQYVYSVIHEKNTDEQLDANNESDSQRKSRLSDLVTKYTKDLPRSQVTGLHRETSSSVILTGSTGSLGNYILSELLKDPNVSKVYCLNRSADAEARQVVSFEEKGLLSGFSSRVEFHTVQFGAEKFGLSPEIYDKLKNSVDVVIHNAWKVNFNHRVETFENTHIDGVRQLVEYSFESPCHPHIHFISSIGTIGNALASPPAEVPMKESITVLRQGYAESKYVAERICDVASERLGIPTTIHRVGQIAGPTTEKGVWNKQEWLPSLVATSKTLHKVPRDLGSMSVSWIPVDSLAKIIVEITRSRKKTEIDVRCAAFHLINPSNTEWETLLPAMQKYYSVEPISLADWVKELEVYSNPMKADIEDKPSLKILDFYRNLNTSHGGYIAETTKAEAASETMRNLQPINKDLMDNWLKQWGF
ncbi:NRPS-like enzyme [Talaromyces proteolyticus]|uniref:NRPS-like enzyme n=1 Tax=Talaromyces proteolyticus TaxID=1131652 RepID=A0AAD4L2R6_9EURO|nr:NRPS-like enzyme [Talaromyces proteolyticus]KAH8703509.1 NRPS-like enzyme [Talaromyces proteolyticus]